MHAPTVINHYIKKPLPHYLPVQAVGESTLAVKFQQSLIHVLRTDHLQVKESKRSDGRNMAIMDAPRILPAVEAAANEHHRRSKNNDGGNDALPDNQDDDSEAEEAKAFHSAIEMALDKLQGEEQLENEREQRRKHRKKGLVPHHHHLHESGRSGTIWYK